MSTKEVVAKGVEDTVSTLTGTGDLAVSALMMFVGLLVIGIIVLWLRLVKVSDASNIAIVKFSESLNEIKVVLATLAARL